MGITRKSTGGGGGGTPSALQAVKVRYDAAVNGGASGSAISLHTFAAGTYIHSAYMIQVAAFVKGIGDPPSLSVGIVTATDLVPLTFYNASVWALAYMTLIPNTSNGSYLASGADLAVHVDDNNDQGVVSGQYDFVVFYFTPASL